MSENTCKEKTYLAENKSSDTNMTRREFLEKGSKASAALALTASLSGFPFGTLSAADLQYDVIIKNGTVHDGYSPNPRVLDIGIKGDKIVTIGKITGSAVRVIDAANLIVTPGFIDMHTHCDVTFQVAGWKRHLAVFMPSWKGNYNYLYQGVTTVVSGNCGLGFADTDSWLNRMDDLDFGSNVYHLAPHGVIRWELFGENQPGELTPQQLSMLKRRVAEEMEKGAVGLSLGLEYAPGILTGASELIEMAKVVRQYGGVVTIHRRDETGRIHEDGLPGTVRSTQETIEIARSAEVPVQISHIKIGMPYNDVRPEQLIEIIAQARDQGLDVSTDLYPYPSACTYITYLIPNRFKGFQGSVKEEFRTGPGRQELEQAIEHVFSYLAPDKILVSICNRDDSLEGKSIREISDQTGKTPSTCFADLICDDPSPWGIFFMMKPDDVKEFSRPDFALTASDGATVPRGMTMPHPRLYGTFPRKIKEFVVKENVIDLAQAIRSMTSLPAEKFRMKGRGKILEGNFADIAVLDLNSLSDHATYGNPHQYSTGVQYLLVNGVVSIEDGKATGDRGGRALRS